MHSSIDIYIVLAIVNDATVNIEVQIPFWDSVFVFFEKYPEMELMNDMAFLLLIFEELPYRFPRWLNQFAIPLTMPKGPLFSKFLTTLVISHLFYASHSNIYKLIFNFGFELHFPHD